VFLSLPYHTTHTTKAERRAEEQRQRRGARVRIRVHQRGTGEGMQRPKDHYAHCPLSAKSKIGISGQPDIYVDIYREIDR